MIALPAAKAVLREAYASLQSAHEKDVRLTQEEYEQVPVLIAECRNLLNCIEENIHLVRP